eukprot:3604632-Amphidinium_carterae.1
MAETDPLGPSTPSSSRSERRALRARDHHSNVAPSPGFVPVPAALAALSPLPLRDVSSPAAAAAAAADADADADADVSSASPTVIASTPHVAALQLTQTPPRTSKSASLRTTTTPNVGPCAGPSAPPFARAMSTQPVLQPPASLLESVHALPLPTASDGTKKYRSGAPPQAPTDLSLSFHQCAQEPHSLRQWKRKVTAWELRASQHVPPEELGLLLIEALSGDPALLCQDLPIAELYTVHGVQRILDQLAPLEQQRVRSFQQAMRAYEQLRRGPSEATRAFHARFMTCEQQLLRLGLTGYSGESRAIKWMSGMDLPSDTQRLILSSAGSYDIDRLLVSLELHFGGGVPPTRSKGKGKEGKDGKGKGSKGHAAHVTDAPASAASEPDGVPEETGAPTDYTDYPVDEWSDMNEVAEALSVTAQKLRHITQSRGWYQPGKGGKDKGKSKGKDSKGKGSKGSAAVTTALPAPPATRWDSATQSGSSGSRMPPPQPPLANPPKRVHATVWEQAASRRVCGGRASGRA